MEMGEFVVVLLSIFYPHIIYILLVRGNKLISDNIYILKNPAIWMLYISIAYVSSPHMGIFFIMSYYLINAYVITRINFSSEYFILGVMVTLFQSEFWEIPMQVFYSPPMNIWHIGIAVSRLFTIIEVIWLMDDVGLDVYSFISNTIVFAMLYYAFVIVTFDFTIMMHNTQVTNFIYRLLCSMFFINAISNLDKLHVKKSC